MRLKWKKCLAVLMLCATCSTTLHAAEVSETATVPPESTQRKVMYLTFDDGPTQGVTEDILDTLKEKDVKATFFVVGKEIIDREAILKRMYDEGHTIGLHSYTHNYKKIYQSPEIFMQEMEDTEAKINEVLGTDLDIKIIRFPGGTSGRLTNSFLEKLHEQSYLIYDWNVNVEDGIQPSLSPSQLLVNAKKCSWNTTERILLAHCTIANKTTAQALESIIDYYAGEGYTFEKIEDDTKEFYYPVKK